MTVLRALILYQTKTHPPSALVEVVADNLETGNLAGVGHVVAGTGADVVVAYTHQAQCLGGIGGEFAEIHLGRQMVAVYVLDGYVKVAANDSVHLVFDGLNLLWCGCSGQLIVTLAFFTLNMSVPRPRPAEHPHHGLVQKMLSRVHRRVLLHVQLV